MPAESRNVQRWPERYEQEKEKSAVAQPVVIIVPIQSRILAARRRHFNPSNPFNNSALEVMV